MTTYGDHRHYTSPNCSSERDYKNVVRPGEHEVCACGSLLQPDIERYEIAGET